MTKEDIIKIQRIDFLEGMITGITLYAIWKDGEQLVGCLQKPLRDVLKPYQEELEKLRTEDSK